MMDTMAAFARGEASRGNRIRVFDWDKAARLIFEQKVTDASAGLQGDWEWTGGTIFKDGVIDTDPMECLYLSSTWAIPELCLYGDTIDCWVYADETDGWDCHTVCPESACAILDGEG